MSELSLAEHDCLPLLLQHSSINQDVKLLCTLLCVNKAMRTNIAQQCRCQLALECTCDASLAKASLLALFLRRWAGLAKTLELNWNRISLPAGEESLAEALQAAAAGTDPAAPSAAAAASVDICTGPLQIKALKANVAGPLLLAVMPAATLTCLELGHAMDYVTEGTAETGLCGALAKLTGLQDLTVLSAASHLLLPATSALTALTRVCIQLRDLPQTVHKLQHLPPQLHKLEVTVGWMAGARVSGGGGSRPALPLRHLTGLQEFRGSGYFALQANDELPGGLQALQVPDCPAATPLLHLTNLTTLNMYNSTARAAQLCQLAAALPQLSEVSLGYFGAEESPDVDAAAPGWPGLPLRALDFDSNSGEFRLGAPALDALGRLGSCLTQLALSGGVLVETTPTGLSQVLSRLTKLHTLRLASVELQPEAPLTAVAAPTLQHTHTHHHDHGPQQSGASSSGINRATTAVAAAPAGPAGVDTTSSAGAGGGAVDAAAAGAIAAAGSSGGSVAAAARSKRSTRSSGTRVEFLGPAYSIMAAAAGLASLRSLKLGGLTGWLINPTAELQPLSSATQLTCLHMMDMQVSDEVVASLVQGLTQLRELDVSDNVLVSDGALSHIGTCLSLLRHLDVSGCSSVTEGGIRGLKARLPGVDVVCFQSSGEEWL